MDNIELYINGKLCNTGSNFGVRLKRQLINSAELNTKDAQMSYGVTLPLTPTNDRIFNYTSIEETNRKFNREYNAELIINSYRIFIGKFRLSEINRDGYKGNLVVPVAKTIKDIFGESKLTENAPLEIEFKDFTEYINYWNNEAKKGLAPCMFPYVLYGLLPKTPSSEDGNIYSDRDLWDETVRLGMQDLPPSVNVLSILKHIFESKGYALGGTAFDDAKLSSLYMSYKNETDYTQPWNYGRQAYMKLTGSWLNFVSASQFEHGLYENEREASVAVIHGKKASSFFTADLLRATQSVINITEDKGANIVSAPKTDTDGTVWTNCLVSVPATGFYKIRVRGSISIADKPYFYYRDGKTGIRFVGDNSDLTNNLLKYKRYELKLLRDYGTGDFGLNNTVIDGTYYRDNLPQNDTFDDVNYPKYFPQMKTPATDLNKLSQILIVDPAQNAKLVCGLSWGGFESKDYNPKGDSANSDWAKVLVAKSGFSWDINTNDRTPPKVIINSPGYWKYGIIGDFANADEQYITRFEDANIRYNVYFDANGLLQPNPNPDLYTTKVVSRYELQPNQKYVLGIPDAALWQGSIYIYDTPDTASPYVEKLNQGDYWTGSGYEFIIDTTDTKLYISFELAHTPIAGSDLVFDITSSVRLTYLTGDDDILGWELTNKYRIVLNNAPVSYARRGWYKGAYSDNTRKGDGEVQVIAWLEAGEALTLAAVSDIGGIRENNPLGAKREGWPIHGIDFELDITPFRTNEDWAKINSKGNGTAAMNWNDPDNFKKDVIDLVKFLPADMKTDDFIDNFCKAFNLKLYQTGTNAFALDVKQTKKTQQNNFIDLDLSASVRQKSNQSLGLPSEYSIGFTISEDEEGYVMSGDNGGGSFYTGAIEESITEQKSNFSYNWFKNIRKEETAKTVVIPLPVISKAEVWTTDMTYPEAMSKRYTNLAGRFWYFDGLLNDLGATFKFGQSGLLLEPAKVSNILPGLNTLNYKDENNTILNNYFSLLTDANSHYTVIECYLQPDQYEDLGNGAKVRFNGDMYYVADIDGYDPLNKNMCTVKLIRQI